MLKKLSLIALFLGTISMNAQFTLETDTGDPLIDGQVITFDTNEAPRNRLPFFVNNTSTTDAINMRIEFVSAENADGSELEICFGLCYTGTMVGQNYPINDVVVIEPGMTQTSSGDGFKNTSDGGGNVVSYVFRFYQVDENGDEIGEDITISYRFDPALGINDVNTVDATVISTVIGDEFKINTNEDLQVVFYDVLGKLVKSQMISTGRQNINTGDLSSQVYIVQLKNTQGAVQTVKVVKR